MRVQHFLDIDAVTLPGWLGIPGLRQPIGLARWWHFTVNPLWTVNGKFFTDP